MTTKASLLVSTDPLTGALMAWVNDSRRLLTVSKFLLVFSDIRYFPAARTQLSDVNGYLLLMWDMDIILYCWRLTVLCAIPWLMTEGVSSENEDSRRASEDSRSTAFRPSTDAFVNAVFNARVL